MRPHATDTECHEPPALGDREVHPGRGCGRQVGPGTQRPVRHSRANSPDTLGQKYRAEVDAVLADWTTQYDHIWSTKVENRIRLLTVRLEEIEHQLNSAPSTT